MRIKILVLLLVCLMFSFNCGVTFKDTESEEFSKQEKLQLNAMKDIVTIATALADYHLDHGVVPKVDGIYKEDSEIVKVMAPYYVRELPVKDPWGNNYHIYCGDACIGQYGIPIGDEKEGDFMVVSLGRDGKKENWEFSAYKPSAGFFKLKDINDFDNDLVMWNGSWIRAPRGEY